MHALLSLSLDSSMSIENGWTGKLLLSDGSEEPEHFTIAAVFVRLHNFGVCKHLLKYHSCMITCYKGKIMLSSEY